MCELQSSVPASCPLGLGGGRQPSRLGWERDGRAVPADPWVSDRAEMGRCLAVTLAAGAPDPDKADLLAPLCCLLLFLNQLRGSFNPLKRPAKLSRAQIHSLGGEDVRIFFFFFFWNPLLECKRSCQSRSPHPPQEPGVSLQSPVFLEPALSGIAARGPRAGSWRLRAHGALRNPMQPQDGLSWGRAQTWSPRSPRQAQGTQKPLFNFTFN